MRIRHLDGGHGRRWTIVRGIAAAALAGALLSPHAQSSPETSAQDDEASRLSLATVDGESITLADLRASFGSRHSGHGGLLVGEEVLRTVLEKAIAERLLIQEGHRMGIAEEPRVRNAVAAKRDILLLEELERRFIQEAAEPGAAEVKKAYDLLPRLIRVSLIQTQDKGRAQEAAGRIRIGETFESVARQVSDHPSRTKGGDLGWVTWGILDPATEDAVFSAEAGEIHGPFPTEFGFRLLQVQEEKQGEPPVLEEVNGKIRAILKARRQTELKKELLVSIRNEHPPKEDEEAVSKLLSRDPHGAKVAKEPPDDAVVLVTAAGLELTAGRVRGRARSQGLPLREAWRLASDDALLIDEARRRIEADARIEREVKVFEDAMVRAEVERVGVLRNFSVDEAEAKSLYEKDPSVFARPSSYHLRHILLASRDEALEVKAALQGGADFAALARERSKDAESSAAGGDIGWVDAPAGGVPETIRSLRPGEFSNVIESPQGFSIVQVVEVRGEEIAPFEEVRQEVSRRLVIQKQKELRETFVGKLRKGASVKVHEKAFARAVAIQDELASGRLGPGTAGSSGGSR